MGMTIDEAKRYLRLMLSGMKYAVRYWEGRDIEEKYIEQTNVEAVETAIETMRKYQMFQANYEARLNADMVAMLADIQIEIEERKESIIGRYGKEAKERNNGRAECLDLIQQKIDKLIIQLKINKLNEVEQ